MYTIPNEINFQVCGSTAFFYEPGSTTATSVSLGTNLNTANWGLEKIGEETFLFIPLALSSSSSVISSNSSYRPVYIYSWNNNLKKLSKLYIYDLLHSNNILFSTTSLIGLHHCHFDPNTKNFILIFQ
jgi:hypothetical protein